jgi:hypothetical protein
LRRGNGYKLHWQKYNPVSLNFEQKTIPKTPMKYLSLLLSSLLFVACGGGGSATSTSATTNVAAITPIATVSNVSTETFQVRQAFLNDFNNTGALPFTFGGTVSGASISGAGTISQSAISAVTFNGLPAQMKTRTTTGNATLTLGTTVRTTPVGPIADAVHINSSGNIVGFVSSGVYAVALTPIVVPSTAKVGDKGEMGKLTIYSTSAKTAVTGSAEYSYSLEVDTATTAILTVTLTQKTTGGVSQGTQKDTYRITPAGAVKPLSTLATLPDLSTLSFNF